MARHKKKPKHGFAGSARAQSLPPSNPPGNADVTSNAALSTPPRKPTSMATSFGIEEPRDFQDSPSYAAEQRAKHRKAAREASSHRFIATMVPDLDSVYAKLNSKFNETPEKIDGEKIKTKQRSTPLLKQLSKAKAGSATPSASVEATPKSEDKKGAQSSWKARLAPENTPHTKPISSQGPQVIDSSKKKKKKNKAKKTQDEVSANTKTEEAAAIQVQSTPPKNEDEKPDPAKKDDSNKNPASVSEPKKISRKKLKKAKKRAEEAAAAAKAALVSAEETDSNNPTDVDEKQRGPTESFNPGYESESSAEDINSTKPAEGTSQDGRELSNSERDDESEDGPVSQAVKAMTKKRGKKKATVEFKSAERIGSAKDNSINSSENSGGSEADDESRKTRQLQKDDALQVPWVSDEESNDESERSDITQADIRDRAPAVATTVVSESSEAETESDHENDADSESESASKSEDNDAESSTSEEAVSEQSKPVANPRKRKRVDSAPTPSSVASRNPLPDLMQFPSVAAAVAAVHKPSKKVKKTAKSDIDKRKSSDNAYPKALLKLTDAFEDILPDYKYKGDKKIDPNVRLAALLDNARNTVLRLSTDRVRDNGGPSAAMQVQLTRIAKEREEEVANLRGQVWELMEEQKFKKVKKER